MTRWRIILVGVLALLLQPGKAEAQWDVSNFVNLCVSGSLKPCGSVIVKTQWDELAGKTLVEMWVRNEQGSTEVDNTGGSFLTQIGLTAPTIGEIGDFSVRLEGDVGLSEPLLDPNDLWELNPGPVGGRTQFRATTTTGKELRVGGKGDAFPFLNISVEASDFPSILY